MIPETTKINGKIYKVTKIDTGKNLTKDLLAKGWDGNSYSLEGKRGAMHLAYRSALTGIFYIVATM